MPRRPWRGDFSPRDRRCRRASCRPGRHAICTPEGVRQRERTVWIHAAGLAGQAALLRPVAGLDRRASVLVALLLAAATAALPFLLRRLRPHGEMVLAMASLGGLGMTFGWWADLGFPGSPELAAATAWCRASGSHAHLLSWMNASMLLAGVAAMRWVARRNGAAACTPGALGLALAAAGMTAGMLAGSALLGWLAVPLALGELAHRLGDWIAMIAGMVGGMLLTEWTLARVSAALPDAKRRVPPRTASKATPPGFGAERLPSTIAEYVRPAASRLRRRGVASAGSARS